MIQLAIGPVPSPFDCYLANRGLKTLHLRMRQHQVNAMAVAKFLEQNPRVEKVVYPGTVFITVGGGGYVTMFRGIFVNNFLLNVQLEKIFLPPPPKQKGIGISWVWGGFYD